MSNKILWGALIGATAAVAAAMIYDGLRGGDDDEVIYEDYENDEIIDKANEYLSEARVKARELVDYANRRSDELLGEANNILLIAKEMAENAVSKGDPEAEEELNNAKAEIERLISEYQNKLKQ